MARQGNYVTLPGGGVNFTKDLSNSLSGLSKSLLDQGSQKREQEREDALLAIENERYKTKQDRLALEQRRADKEHQLKLDQREAVKNAQFNGATIKGIQTRKARDVYGVTDEQFEKFRDEGLLDTIPVYKEDLLDHYASIHASRFGTPFDPSSVSHLLGGVDSLKELQAREDANAVAEAAQLKTAANYDLKKLKALSDLTGISGGSSKGGGSGAAKALASINKPDMVQDLEGSSFWNFLGIRDSEKEKGKRVADDLQEVLSASRGPNGEKLTTAEINTGMVYGLNQLKTGQDLKDIDDSEEAVIKAATDAIDLTRTVRSDPSKYGFNSSGSVDLGSTGKFQTVLPRNLKEENRARVRRELDELFGRTSPQAPATSGSAPTQTSGTTRDTLTPPASTKTIAPSTLGSPAPKQTPTSSSASGAASNTTSNTTASSNASSNASGAANDIVVTDNGTNRSNKPVNRRELLLNNTPSYLVDKEDVGPMEQFFRTAPRPQELDNASSRFGVTPSQMSEIYTNFNSALDALGAPDNARQQRIDRYSEDRNIVRQVNAGLDSDNHIKTETLFVLPFDEKGANKSWNTVVNEINDHPSIKLFNKISSKEIEEARNNPSKQQEIIDRANNLITAKLVENSGTQRMLDLMTDRASDVFVDPLIDFWNNHINTADAGSEEYKRRLKSRIDDSTRLGQNIQALDVLDSYVDRRRGLTPPTEPHGGFLRSLKGYNTGRDFNTNQSALEDIFLGVAGAKTAQLGLKALPQLGRAVGSVRGGRAAASPKPRTPPKTTGTVGPKVSRGVDKQAAEAAKGLKKVSGKGLDDAVQNVSKYTDKALERIIRNPGKYSEKVVEKAQEIFLRRIMNKPYSPPGRLPSVKDALQLRRPKAPAQKPGTENLRELLDGGVPPAFDVPFNPLRPTNLF